MAFKIIRTIIVFSGFCLIIILLTRLYFPFLPGYENSVGIVRRHALGDPSLIYFDQKISFFPTILKTSLWNERTIYFLINLPLVSIITLAVSLVPQIIYPACIFFLLYFVPVKYLGNKAANFLVIKTNFRLLLPFSKKTEWLWSTQETPPNTVTSFAYNWNQTNQSHEAVVRVSCLGHYRLVVNNSTVYYGPTFTSFPDNYYDEIGISKWITRGENRIVVDCESLDVRTHEHPTFPYPAVLVGGYIRDGMMSYNLADSRFWFASSIRQIMFGKRLSADAGFLENTDLTKTQNFDIQTSPIRENLRALRRPTPELILSKLAPIEKDGYWDLGRLVPGYLILESDQKEKCQATISFHDGYRGVPSPTPLDGQIDQISLPAGNVIFQQFSRRLGRFLHISDTNCHGNLGPKFVAVEKNLDLFSDKLITDPLDKSIFAIANNSVRNGAQEQIEDSLVRERALYVGDAYSAYQCFPKTENNQTYFKYILQSFAKSQLEDGSIPAMAHSQNNFVIGDYSLIWAIFLDEYISTSGDIAFGQETLPVLEKLYHWTQDRLSDEGFLFDKKEEGWWTFIDWTKPNMKYRNSTALQIYYLQFLKSYSNILLLLGRDNRSITSQFDQQYQRLLSVAYSEENHLFVDSFDGNGKTTEGGVITNSLAGKFQLFPDKQSSRLGFESQKNIDTGSPYSETWIADWGVRVGDKISAQNIIRRYWGKMVSMGSTSVYEVFSPGQTSADFSHSHIWGCGSTYLYQKIYEKIP